MASCTPASRRSPDSAARLRGMRWGRVYPIGQVRFDQQQQGAGSLWRNPIWTKRMSTTERSSIASGPCRGRCTLYAMPLIAANRCRGATSTVGLELIEATPNRGISAWCRPAPPYEQHGMRHPEARRRMLSRLIDSPERVIGSDPNAQVQIIPARVAAPLTRHDNRPDAAATSPTWPANSRRLISTAPDRFGHLQRTRFFSKEFQ